MQLPQEQPVPNPTFSLPAALNLLYGLAQPVSFPGVREAAEQEAPQVSFAGIELVPDAEAAPMTSLGTPILHPITFVGGTYRTYSADGRVVDLQMGDLRLPVSTVVEMATAKTITRTQVSASGGSVKEVFSFGEWDIRLTGIVMDEEYHPHGAHTLESMEHRLRMFDRLADSIAVESDLLNRRGVDRLVIRSISFASVPGRPRMIGFQMQCESDAALELML